MGSLTSTSYPVLSQSHCGGLSKWLHDADLPIGFMPVLDEAEEDLTSFLASIQTIFMSQSSSNPDSLTDILPTDHWKLNFASKIFASKI